MSHQSRPEPGTPLRAEIIGIDVDSGRFSLRQA